VLGTALASKNNLSVNSTFTAYGATIKVVGIFDAGNTFSNSMLVMPLATVQTLSKQVGDVTSATVTIDDVSNVTSATTAITSALGSAADVTNDQQRAQESITPLQNIQSISLYSLIGSVVAGAVIILLTMIMIVRERRREIGVIKAIGASNIKVIFQFMSEAVTFTLLAAIIGIGIGIAAGNPITNMLVNNSTSSSSSSSSSFGAGGPGVVTRGSSSDMPTPGGGAGFMRARSGFGGGVRNTISNLHTNVGWDIILYGLGAAIAIAILGSAVASWFIAKVRPAEVMRTE
jgi:putative ABC transport system permease protein